MATLAARAARGPSEDSRDGRRCRCRACHLRNCKACRDFYANTADWVAASCRSGEPLPNSELSRRPSRRRSLGGAEGTRRSVRRAWTISSGSSSPRWSVPRREVREYSSLPRNRSSGDYPSLRRGAGGAGAAGHGLGADQGGHTDSGVGTQDEAEHGEPLHLVRTMLERARQREDALKTVSNATRAARPVSLSLLGLGTAGTTGSSGGHSATSASPTSGPASSSVSPSAEMFPRRGSGPCGAPGPPGPPGPFGRSKGLKGLKGRRRRSAGATAISVSPQQQQTEWSEGSPGSPCARARRRCPDPGGGASLPAGAGAAAEAETGRSLLEGDDFRLVFISSDSSSRDEDEPRSEDDDEEDIGDCMSTSSGGMGPALDDCDWDYFEPSVAPRELPESPVATPVLRRHRHARVFLDGSPSSSDCSSSGWATYQPGHYTPHRDQRDWDAGRGGVWARVPGVVLGPSSICCRSPQHGRRHVRLDAAQAAQAASLPLPVPNATATAATAAAGTGSGTSTTGQVGPVGPIPGPSQARAVVVAQRGAVSGCASCSSGSLVPILVPIPVPVPVLVPIPQYQDDVSVAMRPQSTGGGQGGGRRRKGGRGRRSGKGTKTTAASPAPASTASSSIAPGGDGGRRVSRSSSVAEETDNGVVLVTFRQIKEDAKPDQDQADGAPDDAEVVDDDAVFEDPMEKRLQEAGKEEEGKKEDDEDGDEVEMKEDEKSSCASTSSSDDDTNVDFDSDSVDVDDDSDDEEVSRTYRLRDGATLTRGLGGLRSEVSASSSSSRSSRSSVGSGREKREDDEEEDDSDGEPFSQVFVVNSPSSTDEDQKHATSASSALSKSTRVAASADSGPRVDRCAQRPRAAPPPPPPPPSATPVAPPASDDTSQVTIVACSGTEAASDTGASVGADAASGETAPAVPAALVPVVPVVPVVPAGADIDTTRIQDDPPGLSTPCAEPSDGMKTKGPDGPSCPPSATGQEGAATDMFGMCSGEPEVGVAALNKEVIGVVAPEELARLGGHLECLSVIECPAASGNGSTAPAADSPVALKDILRDESLRPEAEMQTPAEEEEGDGDGEFSGTESMELSPPGHDQDGVDPDHEGQGLQSQQQQPQQHQQSVERSRRSASGGAAVEGIESSVSPLDCAAGAADAAVVKAQTAMGPCLAGPESELCSRSRSRSPAEEAVVGRASSAHDEAEVEAASPKYTSLVMITPPESPVSVSVGPASGVTLLHTNLEEVEEDDGDEDGQIKDDDEEDDEEENAPLPPPRRTRPNDEDVQVVTGADTLSAVICLEEGMADDDSWVEEVEPDRDMDMETTATDTSSGDEGGEREGAVADREEELRGYHRAAIDFTLHTILEESCEESESESNKPTPRGRVQSLQSASELEKYFFFELGGGTGAAQQDAMSESNSSIYSEGLESLGTEDGYGEDGNTESQPDPAELASSRLEKYFLSGFMGFPGSSRRDSDGSVGSDSEGRPSPEQRRKRLVRARGTGRAAHSSQDNLASPSPQQPAEPTAEPTEVAEDADDTEGSSTEEESPGAPGEEPALAVDGQFDTVKRKKRKRSVGSGPVPSQSTASAQQQGPGSAASASSDERDVCVSPAPGPAQGQDLARSKHHSRDSGFVGSCDDLLNKTASDSSSSSGQSGITTPADASPAVDSPALLLPSADVTAPTKAHTPTATASSVSHPGALLPPCTTTPPATSLTRRDSFNNWSSDEETNLMMSKMRAFFKNMTGRQQAQQAQQPAPQDSTPQQQQQQQQQARRKPPQLVYFESELTRLMKTVPGIRDEQVRELVEYLSSEDTWSDSYDSSDYTSSDLESATGVRASSKRALQEQISASCQQIISNFDTASDSAAGPGHDDTSVVYQRLIASLSRMGEAEARPGARTASAAPPPPHASPPIFAKVMQHIGGRLVALMHEVSGQAAPRERYVHRRLQQKVSVASTTTEEDEDDDSVTDTEPDRGVGDAAGADVASPGTGTGVLARSRSHDLLGERDHGHDLNAEEREASDYERFSWRGSFESALMAADSRSRLSCGADSMTSPVSTAAKRRSAGDLLYSHRSRERLDRVRSCGSIGGTALCTSPGPGTGPHGGSSTGPGAELTWKARRASVPDANMSGGSADGDDDDDGEDEPDDEDDDHDHHHHHEVTARSTTLPRSLQATRGAGTNSLPRLPTSGSGSASTAGLGLLKANTLGQVQGVPGVQSVQSARYRPPGYSRQSPSATSGTLGNPPKRAMSAPGLGPHPAPHPRRERRKHLQQSSQGEFSVAAMRGAELRSKGDESCLESSEAHLSTSCTSYSASPSPVSSRATTQRPTRTLGRDWLPDEDVLAARLQPLGPIPHVTNLGRSDSLASVYSGAGEGRYGTVAVRGEVEFGLQYNYKQNALEIHVVQCKDLAPVDVKRNRSDPYVKVYLLPDKSKGGKRKTRVKKHTLNPYFDETLKFHINLKGLESRTLWLTVWHSDMFGRNDFLGEVMMNLEKKVFDDPSPRFYPLQERTEPFDDVHSYRGDMIVALKFIPPDVSGSTLGKKGKRSSKGELHVLVKEAKNLTAVKANGMSDPFCKSYLLPDKGRSSKQKTAVIRRSCNPAWNHTFIYSDISLQELSERSLELTVWDHDRIASNEFLGGVRFNLGTGKHYAKPVDWMDSSGKELTLWQRMLERPNLWVESSITLRTSLERTVASSSNTTT